MSQRTHTTLTEADDLTHCNEVAVVLQHHLSVQVSLNRVQALPFFPAEVDGHIPEGH